MSNEQNLKRIYANISGIPVAKWSDPARKMNDRQKEIAAKTISRISSFKIFMNDKAIEIDDICVSIRRHANELPQGKYLPIVDHFHLIENSSVQDFRHWAFYHSSLVPTPDARSTEVLSSGTSRGLSGEIPVGGQQPPRSCVGTRLEW